MGDRRISSRVHQLYILIKGWSLLFYLYHEETKATASIFSVRQKERMLRETIFPSGTEVRARFTTLEAWKLPKQSSSVAPSYVWSNAGAAIVIL